MSLTALPEYNIVITDTSCLILLEKIGGFEILQPLSTTVTTTPEIKEEFGINLPSWIKIATVKDISLVEVLKEIVDPGEASAIALAIETANSLVIVDDLKGRKLAKRMNLNVMGTLGMLLKAKQRGVIPLIKPYIDRIQETDFRISQEIIDYVIEQAGE